MRDLNKVMLIGRLGRDPELRYLADGTPLTTLTLATGRQWRDAQGQQQEHTEWISVVLWRKLGEIAGQYLSKGRMVYIEGRMQTRSWDDDAGQKHYKTEVVAQELILLDSRRGEGAQLADEGEGAEEESWSEAPVVEPGRGPTGRPRSPRGLAASRQPAPLVEEPDEVPF